MCFQKEGPYGPFFEFRLFLLFEFRLESSNFDGPYRALTQLSILERRHDIQKYSPWPCGYFKQPISHAEFNIFLSIFGTFGHLPRPPQPKIRIFTNGAEYQK